MNISISIVPYQPGNGKEKLEVFGSRGRTYAEHYIIEVLSFHHQLKGAVLPEEPY